MLVDGYVSIYKGVKIVTDKNCIIKIGSGTYINECSRIFCRKGIKIGSHCAIGFNVDIMDSDLHSIYADNLLINNDEYIVIGNNVWICAHTMVGKGSFVGNNIIIGANSRVNGILASDYIYAGNPLKRIRQFENWQ